MTASQSAEKIRLDRLLVERGLAAARERARALILAGQVMVNGAPVTKVGALVPREAAVSLRSADQPYVSRGGVKLAAALDAFNLDVSGQVALDVGASTGGFTDCLLQHGAARVYSVDVGYGQLAWRLRQDPRVIVLERTNIRYLRREAIPEEVDLAVVDVSFISLKLVMPQILLFLRPGGIVLALVKPQFEVGKGQVGKGGVVRDPELQLRTVEEIKSFSQGLGLVAEGVVPSPILGPKGNQEYLLYLHLQDRRRSD
jgi:23S rRNA (cytidine1920-2'-O)/16S rRNA (cytidine1409-2'-O)-methyltransferase